MCYHVLGWCFLVALHHTDLRTWVPQTSPDTHGYPRSADQGLPGKWGRYHPAMNDQFNIDPHCFLLGLPWFTTFFWSPLFFYWITWSRQKHSFFPTFFRFSCFFLTFWRFLMIASGHDIPRHSVPTAPPCRPLRPCCFCRCSWKFRKNT